MEDGRGGMNQDLLTANKESSYEISQLYDVFKDLIQDKQFSQNDFLKNPDTEDVLSIINLAATCEMYEQNKSNKATGVCYNNIANLHLKNGKYESATMNYEKAIEKAKLCLKKYRGTSSEAYYNRVFAHRKY